MPRPKSAAGAKQGGAQNAAQEAQLAADALPASQQPTDADASAPAKKKRNNNPGVRVQGGRVYDSQTGTTCHQCRQKTVETKAKCTACTLYFCPKCLENRYQEGVEGANAAGDWRCPRCRGDCNCSNCRKKQGKEATGQLAGIAKKAGFGSVKDLLQKNPNAKAIQLPRAAGSSEPASGAAAAEGGEGQAGAPPAAAARRRPTAATKRKAAEAAAEHELVEEEALPPREQGMPAAQPLAVHKAAVGGSGGASVASRRLRGVAVWTAGVPAVTAVPEGQAGAELAVVLEFLQVFGPKLQLRAPCLASLAAELLQPAAEVPGLDGAGGQPPKLLCPSEEESLVGAVHCRLLELVRGYWNVKGGVSVSSWQGIMRAYYAASLLTQRQALVLRWQHGPPAVAGEIFHRPAAPEGESQTQQQQEQEEVGEAGTEEGAEAGGEAEQSRLAALGAAPAASVDYPGGSYWALQPEARVACLHALVNDALECGEIRQLIEGSMGDAMDEEKERRQQLAGVRKEARVAVARERDQQIALMIASADGSSMTLEEQQRMLAEARQRAEASAASAAAAQVKALTEKVHPPTVRAALVGSDREGRLYLQLQVAPLLTGGDGVLVQSGPHSDPTCGGSGSQGGAGGSSGASGSEEECLGAYPNASLAGVAAALHPQGRREGPLRAALVRTFKLPAPAAVAAVVAGAGAGVQQGSHGGTAAEAAAAEAPAKAGGRQRGGKAKAAAPAAKSSSPAPEAPAAEAPVKAGGRQRGGKAKAAAAAKSSSPAPPAPAVEEEAGSAGAVGEEQAPAGKRRRQQSSEGGSSAEQATPKRPRARAPAAAPKPAGGEAGTTRSRRRAPAGKAAGKAEAAPEAEEGPSVSLPRKVDDLLLTA